MNELQNATIQAYKAVFPDDKLKNISERTSIQITRVFRILNGSEMKLTEYEAFQNAIFQDNGHLELFSDIKKYLNRVSQYRITLFHKKINIFVIHIY